jgi:enamine deaminase RidA (YjgF/YER057c/UK114 family)
MPKGIEYLNPAGVPPPQGLYSHVTRVPAGTPLFFVAGQLAVGRDGEVVGKGDFGAQFGQVFANLGTVLRGLDCNFNDVIKFTTYLVHSQDIERFMAERAALFAKLFRGTQYPPNTLVMIDRLVREEFLIEVEAIVQGRD